MSADHKKYGVREACPECWSETIVAKSYMQEATVPDQVQAVCSNVKCHWKGPVVVVK